MKLSLITINFNNAKGLEKTINSVINQSQTDFEYLVIDGGSTDESLDVIMRYQDKISYWISEKDNGIYHAMNKGIQASKGKYCQFLNSGDSLVNNDVFYKIYRYLEGDKIIYGNLIKVWANGKKLKNTQIDTSSMLNFFRGSLNHASAFIPKKFFEQYGLYDESLKIVSDWKFFMQVIGIHGEKVVYVNEDIVYFDMSGISNSNVILDKEERKLVLEQNLPLSVLYDYELYWKEIDMVDRLKRFKIFYSIVWLLERILFKIEKIKLNNLTIKTK